MNTFQTETSYNPADTKRIEEESNIACPKCEGRMFETTDVFDDFIKTTLDCEDCGYIANNSEDMEEIYE